MKRIAFLNIIYFFLFFSCWTTKNINASHYLCTLSSHIMISRALYVAADLNIADFLQEPIAIEDLARKTNTDVTCLKRLLRYLMEYTIFAYDQNGLICNNDTSIFLQSDHPNTVRPFILHDDATRWNALGNLDFSVKTGKPSFNKLYHTDYFSYLENNTVLSERFDQAMLIISEQEDALIAKNINFQGIVADIGGGKGQLLEQIYKAHSGINQLILFDLEQVHTNVTKKDYISYKAGSFFEPITINADIFILKRIIHDWDDKKALEILKNVANAMSETSILYIIDAVVDQCEDRKLILDIDLRLLSIFGGQERTLAEFQKLCDQADLEIIAVKELTSISHIIMCKKKESAQRSLFKHVIDFA